MFKSATAPDLGTGEEVAHLYFKQLVDGMARLLFPCLIAPLTDPRTGFHSRTRRVPQRPQTREPTSGRGWNTQDIRLWPFCRLQTKGDWEDAASERALWQLTLYRT